LYVAEEGFEVRVTLDGEDVFARFVDGVCLVPNAAQRVLALAALAQCMVLLTGPLAQLEADTLEEQTEQVERVKPALRVVT
jgi:uncharacterized protein (DUF4213/DUF364 family)